MRTRPVFSPSRRAVSAQSSSWAAVTVIELKLSGLRGSWKRELMLVSGGSLWVQCGFFPCAGTELGPGSGPRRLRLGWRNPGPWCLRP